MLTSSKWTTFKSLKKSNDYNSSSFFPLAIMLPNRWIIRRTHFDILPYHFHHILAWLPAYFFFAQTNPLPSFSFQSINYFLMYFKPFYITFTQQSRESSFCSFIYLDSSSRPKFWIPIDPPPSPTSKCSFVPKQSKEAQKSFMITAGSAFMQSRLISGALQQNFPCSCKLKVWRKICFSLLANVLV